MRPTTFIVGAGASAEFRMPLGWDLADGIRHLLVTEIRNQYEGDVFDALRSRGLTDDYYGAAADVAGGLVAARSIDRFLFSRRERPHSIEVGKLGIAAKLLRAEANSGLGLSDTNWQTLHGATYSARESWLGRLFARMQESCRPDDCGSIFEHVEFVTFNYDRIIEQYLEIAFRHIMNQSVEDAHRHAAAVSVIHVYGSLGQLPAPNRSGIAFGADAKMIPQSVAGLRTFMEGADDGTLAAAREAIARAENIVILGFGFDRLNVDALFTGPLRSNQSVFGTNMGVADSDFRYFSKLVHEGRTGALYFSDVEARAFMRDQRFLRILES